MQQQQAAEPVAQPAVPTSPRGKGRSRRTASIQSDPNQQPGQPQFAHKQIPVSAQSTNWQTGISSAQMYTMAHSSSSSSVVSSSMLVQQPQLRFQHMFARPAIGSTRTSSNANGAASSASLDDASHSDSSQQKTSVASSEAAAQPEASGGMATAGPEPCRGDSLYACTPPGRPPGRRCAVVRWVLNQRALWREGQLTPIQMQYMTILGGCH